MRWFKTNQTMEQFLGLLGVQQQQQKVGDATALEVRVASLENATPLEVGCFFYNLKKFSKSYL